MSKRIKLALVSFGCLALMLASCIVYFNNGFDKLAIKLGISNKCPYNFVRFIDVGQGDCALIHSDGKYVLIDTGSNEDDGMALSRKLRDYNVERIECIIISHDDDDHAGGAAKIIEDFDVEAIICSDYSFRDKESNIYKTVNLAKEKGTAVLNVNVGDKLFFGFAEFKFLWIDNNTTTNNNRSIVTRVSLDGCTFLFTGDINSTIEKRLLKNNVDVKCDVYKAAHHGSSWSNCEEFLDAARPDYCVVSCSKDNMYGFPTEAFLKRLSERNVKLYKTYERGDITFNTTKANVSFKK